MIHIITAGGTIEGLEYSERRDEPKETNVKIKSFLESANVSFPFVVERAFSKDSRFITKDDLKILADKVESSQSDKILITHGTITMVETAKFLGQLNLEKTIVLVGSFVIGLEKNTDAPFNLGYATRAIQSLKNGVYIAMYGNVFSWNNVEKNVKKNRFEDKSD